MRGNSRVIIMVGFSLMVISMVASMSSAQTVSVNLQDKVVRLDAEPQFKDEIRGRVSAIAGDTLVIERFFKGESNYTRVPMSVVTRCRVQDGLKRHTVLGAYVGAAVGCVVSGLVMIGEETPPTDFGKLVLRIPILGGLSGALLGATIGHSARTDRWTDLPTSSLRIGLEPSEGGGLGLRLSLVF